MTDPVENNPLALCDASTVSSKDLIVFEIHYADRIGENYFAKHSLKHDWYFYPKMTPGGVIIIHDCNNEFTGSKRALNDFFLDKLETPIIIPDKSGSAIVVKIES